jgi:hypothetical protein
MIRGHKTYKDLIKEVPWGKKRQVSKETEKIKPSYTWHYAYENR